MPSPYKNLSFFDDAQVALLHPLTLTRPAADLRVGMLTIAQKWAHLLHTSEIGFETRPHLTKLFEPTPNPDLYINGRLLPNATLISAIKELKQGEYITCNGHYLLGRVAPQATSSKKARSIDNNSFTWITFPWDIFLQTASQIQADIQILQPASFSAAHFNDQLKSQTFAHAIYVNGQVDIEPGSFLLPIEGPIYLGAQSKIMAGSFLRGSVALGEHAVLKMGAQIYAGSSIGPHCKVGGEVQNSVFHSYSNKGHSGYIGNSVVGQWCNFGAGSDTSNLKNNYSKVSTYDWLEGRIIDSGQQFLGTIMGDHSKVAIGTRLNTGSSIGAFCNLFSSRFPEKHIPSFSWVGDETSAVFQLHKAFQMAGAMMQRRDIPLTDAYKNMMQVLFELR